VGPDDTDGEEGEWKFVQSHASVGVANEDSFGDLPT
jgi:hypothetical protein